MGADLIICFMVHIESLISRSFTKAQTFLSMKGDVVEF